MSMMDSVNQYQKLERNSSNHFHFAKGSRILGSSKAILMRQRSYLLHWINDSVTKFSKTSKAKITFDSRMFSLLHCDEQYCCFHELKLKPPTRHTHTVMRTMEIYSRWRISFFIILCWMNRVRWMQSTRVNVQKYNWKWCERYSNSSQPIISFQDHWRSD